MASVCLLLHHGFFHVLHGRVGVHYRGHDTSLFSVIISYRLFIEIFDPFNYTPNLIEAFFCPAFDARCHRFNCNI